MVSNRLRLSCVSSSCWLTCRICLVFACSTCRMSRASCAIFSVCSLSAVRFRNCLRSSSFSTAADCWSALMRRTSSTCISRAASSCSVIFLMVSASSVLVGDRNTKLTGLPTPPAVMTFARSRLLRTAWPCTSMIWPNRGTCPASATPPRANSTTCSASVSVIPKPVGACTRLIVVHRPPRAADIEDRASSLSARGEITANSSTAGPTALAAICNPSASASIPLLRKAFSAATSCVASSSSSWLAAITGVSVTPSLSA